MSQIGSSTSKCDPWVEVKQECDIELIDEKDDIVDFALAGKLENRQKQIQSFSTITGEVYSKRTKVRNVEFPRLFFFFSAIYLYLFEVKKYTVNLLPSYLQT